MSTAVEVAEKLPLDANVQAWTPSQYAVMTQLGLVSRSGYNGRQLQDAPAGVIESFLTQCQRTRLDPLARQIYCIERGGKWGVQISIDGFRLIAERSNGYRGQTSAQWTADGREWLDVWLSDAPPAAARVGVYRDGFAEPQYSVATFAGYCPRDRDGNLAPKNQWKTNPSNQLAKCAEMLALRKAFPNELSGLYGTEEMDQAAPSAGNGGRVPKSAAPQATQVEDEPVEAEVVDEGPAFDVGAWSKRIRECLAAESPEAGVGMLRDLHGEAKTAGLLQALVTDDTTLDQVLRQAKAELESSK